MPNKHTTVADPLKRIVSLEGPEGVYQSHFPAHIFFQIPLRNSQISFPFMIFNIFSPSLCRKSQSQWPEPHFPRQKPANPNSHFTPSGPCLYIYGKLPKAKVRNQSVPLSFILPQLEEFTVAEQTKNLFHFGIDTKHSHRNSMELKFAVSYVCHFNHF